jgi:predicted permease
VILFQVVVPVFLIFLTGYVGQKVFSLHIKSISTVALYLMTPALIFRTFYGTTLDATYLHILIYGILLTAIIIAVVKVICWFNNYPSPLTSALILTTAFMNNGNLGAPLILFAFGQEAFQYAVIIMILHTIVMSTIGIYYAARGNFNLKESMLSIAKMPILHAVVLSFFWQYLKLPMPENIFSAINLIGDASIPTIMLVLGMQLAEIKPANLDWTKTVLALSIRLLLSPLIAFGITLILPVDPLLSKVMIVLAATPSAAITNMYALQFDSSPELVSSITFTSTLVSIATLSVLLSII